MAINGNGYPKVPELAADLLEAIIDHYEDFDFYKDTTYRNVARPAVFWPDGKSLGYGYASHMAGTAQKFFAKFEYWGFDDIEDFYCLPIEKRNEFLRNGKAMCEAIFWEESFRENTLESVLNMGNLDYQQQEAVLSSLRKAEAAFHSKLVQEGIRIKNECYGNRRLRWRIRNEKARFKAEDKLRERTQHSFCGGCFAEDLWLQSFRLQERAKGLIGLRERFPSK